MTTMTTTTTTTQGKIIQLNCNNDNEILSFTHSSDNYIQSVNDKDVNEIVKSNESQFVILSRNLQLSDDSSNTKSYQFTDKINSSHIEPLNINSSYTMEKLDEKRENERVYEYLLRLNEVRNWLKECLQLDNIANEMEFEHNLSNGVLLARLAHTFAPHIVPLSKIFDIDQNYFNTNGQICCYRHTDNISLWKDAIRSIHFPEVLIPDTVDIYEGRNIKTVFSLFALAKYLHRMHRGPSIRREENVEFSPMTLNDVRERLKNSDLSLFGNIDEILATIPVNLNDTNIEAIMQLNNSINDKVILLKCLKCFDTNISYVNDLFIDRYQEELINQRKILGINEFLNCKQIQAAINKVNLEKIHLACENNNCNDLLVIICNLDDFKMEYISFYMYALKNYSPLTMAEVDKVIRKVNQNVAIAIIKSQDTLHLNLFLLDDKKDKAKKLLLTSWNSIIQNISLSEFIARLTEEIIIRKKKWESNINERNDEYLRERFNDGELFINVDNEKIIYDKPNKIIKWMLTREEIEDISTMINDKDDMDQKDGNDNEMKLEKAATKIQQWWKKRLFSKNFEELKISDKPSLRVVRQFISLLLHTQNDETENEELKKNRLYATKLINANEYLKEKMMDLDEKIVQISANKIQFQELRSLLKNIRMEANDYIAYDKPLSVSDKNDITMKLYEIIFFHLQTKPQYFVKLMGKYSNNPNGLSDLFRKSVLPVYSYGMSNPEMSLLALLLAKYLHEEIKQLNNPIDFRNNSSTVILQILMELYGKMELQQQQIAELNQNLNNINYYEQYFNLNPINLFESITGSKTTNINKAMENAIVNKIFNNSKQFLIHWAIAYAQIIFTKTFKYPDIIRYIAISARNNLKKHFPTQSDSTIIQVINAWLYNGCWMKVITASESLNMISEIGKVNEYKTLAIRKVISKFIEYSILNFGYSTEKYWLNSLNDAITKINTISKLHFIKFIMQNPPCSIDDEKWKKYESYRPILHLTMCQLHVTLQKFQNDVNEIISKNSQLSQFIANVLSLPIENIKQYVTLHLHPFTSNETDNYDEIFRRTMQYVENCLLSGCPGNNLTQLLAHHTLQKEEEIFRKFLHRNNNNQHIKLTLDETKCHIIRQLSTLEKAKRVTSINNYQSIVTAIAKEINKTDEYRKIRQIDLITMRKLVSELEKTQLDYQKRLERYAKLFEKI